MLRVHVESAKVDEKVGTSAKTGRPYRIREQIVYVYFVNADGVEDRFPAAVKIGLDEAPPYQPGEYTLRPDCLYPGKFQQLSVGRVALVPRKGSDIKAA